jgi:putative sigma-54 modulation protein
MNYEVKSVHFILRQETKEYLDKKIAKIHNAESMIIDLLVTITKDANEFIAEANVNFRWGVQAHVKEKESDVTPAINKLIDVLQIKVTKEKEKVQEKR